MKRGGFSLIELLVVIAILAVLMGILIPSMLNTKQHAKSVICQSNLKELTTSLLMYDLENESFPYGWKFNGFIPPKGGYLGQQNMDQMGIWWLNYLFDYLKMDNHKKTIFTCPSKNISDITLKNIVLYGNYGVNLSICKASPSGKKDLPLSSKKITTASKTLLIADSGYAVISWHHVSNKDVESLGKALGEDTAYIPGLKINSNRLQKSLFFGQEEDALKGRHPGKTVNVGFVDGHVEIKKADAFLVEKTETDYKNRSPLWQPN